MATATLIAALFRERFGEVPVIVASAPGRVNLIGEHTDYNDGFVLPIAIQTRAYAAVSARSDSKSVLRSREFDDALEVTSGDCGASRHAWHDSLRGMLCELGSRANVMIASDIPRGAGLSSSAAVAMAAARALCELRSVPWDPLAMARLGQRVEHEYAGVRSGIMDQLVSAAAMEGEAMRIDCRTYALERLRIPEDVRVVVMDTGTRRALSAVEYNDRRAACEGTVRALKARDSTIRALRDVQVRDLDAVSLSDVQRRRARHVITENGRVARFVHAVDAHDFVTAGRTLNESHVSLRDDYEVSSIHLDIICDAARAHPACLGARLTGAGFGGCAIALVHAPLADAFVAAVQPKYEAASYKKSDFYVAVPSAGARLEHL